MWPQSANKSLYCPSHLWQQPDWGLKQSRCGGSRSATPLSADIGLQWGALPPAPAALRAAPRSTHPPVGAARPPGPLPLSPWCAFLYKLAACLLTKASLKQAWAWCMVVNVRTSVMCTA